MLNELAKEVHQNAIDHGWWKEDRHIGSLLMLMVSELSEALEEFRSGKKPTETYFRCQAGHTYTDCPLREMDVGCAECKPTKPEGIPIELADCIIRILNYCGKEGIDIDEAIRIKHEYNKSRPYRHGGKKI